ncbi:MAG: hypothetical protein E7574_05310 [Ruminococcaceae bacterium]|nr:hypothetical protein [Oscillospiraceae bacterium]
MEKTEFDYEASFSKTLCALSIVLIIAIWMNNLINTQITIFWFYLLFFLFFYLYEKITKKYNLFIRKGTYWIEDGIVFIKKGRKTYNLNNVEALCGLKFRSSLSMRSGMMKVDFGKKTLTLISNSANNIELFSDCGLFPLFETILQYNPELEKDDTLEFWYQIKK